uniref:Uncharacterized protein n=1 Tax=Ascaris lumbricoides TaxID=6252 RepID=A0A0M3ITN0_ASCLU
MESSIESLTALLPTDTFPESTRNNATSPPCYGAPSTPSSAQSSAITLTSARIPALATPPVPELICCSDRYAHLSEQYLQSIPEEESDDLCSQSSCSSRRAPTVIPAHSPFTELSPHRETPPPPVPSVDTQPVPFDQLAHTLRSIDSDTDSSLESTDKCCCKTDNAHHLPFIKPSSVVLRAIRRVSRTFFADAKE